MRRALIALAVLVVPAFFAAPALAAPTFGPATNFPTGIGFPTSVTNADYDGDGNLDLFYEVSTQGLFVRLGDGAGGFGSATAVPATGLSLDFNAVRTAQINTDEDSHPDVVVTPAPGASPDVLVLINDGDGTFTQSSFDLGSKSRPLSADVGDLNGDGDPDLAVLTGSPAFATDNLVVLLGDGDGGFGPASSVNHGGQVNWGLLDYTGVAVGHLDADTNLDIVVLNNDSNNFAVLLGNGDGTFDPPVTYPTGTFASAILLHDFDGNGELDSAVLNGGPDHVDIRLGAGDGTFGAATSYGLGGATGPFHMVATDVNSDGATDLVIVNQGTADFSVLLGNGDGSFDSGVRFATGAVPREITAGDFDEDTRPDLAIARGSFNASAAVSVYRNTTDEKPPNTFIDTHPAAPTNNTTADFTFHGTDPAPASLPLTFECRRDDVHSNNWGSCDTASSDNGTATEGERTFEVRAIDAAGNKDPSPASYSWLVDNTPPDITITNPPNKQRYLLHDTITPAFSCTDPPAGTPPGASGIDTCTATPTDNETLGPHEFKVTATDNAGNTSTKSVAYVIDPPRYGDFVGDDEPLAYYRLNDAVGASQMRDSSGNGHHGEFKSTNPAVSLGRQGAISCARRPHPPRVCETSSDPENKAAYFPGRDGYGFVNGITAPTSAYTMEAWVKPRVNGAMMILGHGGGGQLYRQGNNRLALRQTQDVVADTNAGGFKLIPTAVWTHVAATWNGTTTRLYVNGDLVQTSTSANKPPSGTSTFYVGYGEMAPWFHGDIDEAAYYDHAVDAHRIGDRHKIGTAKDNPSVQAGNSPLNTEGPFTDPTAPKNGGLYAPGNTPNADFACTDPDDVPGNSDIASCVATVDGNPIANGASLPDSLGPHNFLVIATDEGGNVYNHLHQYTVRAFKDIYLNAADGPVAYYRVNEPLGQTTMADASPTGRHGEYKNGQSGGHPGVDGFAHEFAGNGGYGYANGIQAPNYQMTLDAWVRPDAQGRAQSIAGHGDAGELYMSNRRFRFRHMAKTVTAQQTADPGSALPNTGAWSHVVGTWDGVDLKIWVNGFLRGTLEDTQRPSSASTFYVGFGQLAPWFDGRIDEVAYYSTALNANRVYQHFLAAP